MIRWTALAVALLLFWLALSGHYTPWLIGAGMVTSVAVVLLGRRMGFADEEGFPAERLVSGFMYWPWLVKEVVKSAWGVTRIILDPRLPISPTMATIPYSQKTAVGITTYANSITLTPGTLTVEVDQARRTFLVHALTAGGIDDLRGGAMDDRVRRFEGGR